MALSAQACKGIIQHALNNAPVDPLLGGELALMNRAGRVMTGMRNWFYLRRMATLDLIAGSDEVLLPADFHKIEAQKATESIIGAVSLVGDVELLKLRESTVSGSGFTYKGAVFAKDNPGVNGGIKSWVLKLDRTVSTTMNDAFSIVYRSGWQEITSDADEVDIFEFMDELYLQVLRAYVADYQQENVNAKGFRTLDERLAQIKAGVVFAAAARDDQPQAQFGEIEGGHIGGGTMIRDWGSDSTVGDI